MGYTSSTCPVELRQCEISPSSLFLLPSMVSLIICGLYLQTRSPCRDSGIYIQLPSRYLSLDSHRYFNSTMVQTEIIFSLQMSHLCLHLPSILVSNPETWVLSWPTFSPLHYTQSTNSHPFGFLNMCQIHSLLPFFTASTFIQQPWHFPRITAKVSTLLWYLECSLPFPNHPSHCGLSGLSKLKIQSCHSQA